MPAALRVCDPCSSVLKINSNSNNNITAAATAQKP